MKEIIRQESNIRMSQSVTANGFIFLAGQVADNLAGDIKSQTKCVLSKIEMLLEKSDFNKTDLIDIKIYIKNSDDFNSMNEVYEEWLGGKDQPARLCLLSVFPNPEYLVEIQAIAAKV